MSRRDRGKGNRAHDFVTVKKKKEKKNGATHIYRERKREGRKVRFILSRRSNNGGKRHQIKRDVTWDRW